MADLGGKSLETGLDAAIDDQPAAMAGADDDAEDDARAGACPVDRLRHRQAVRVIGQAHRSAKRCFEIAAERLAIEKCRVGIADQPGLRRRTAGDAKSDGAAFTGCRLDACNEVDHRADAIIIAGGRRVDAMAGTLAPVARKRDDFHLGAAPVDADEHGV
jgi:hypothetical protein